MLQKSTQPKKAAVEFEVFQAWVLECLEQFAVWQVRTNSGDWFCPYCGQEFCFGADLSGHPEQVVDHLAHECEPFEKIRSVPIFPEKELRRRSLPPTIRAWMKTDQSWHVRDSNDRWVCPYCLEKSKIVVTEGRVNKQVFEAIVTHVLACPAFDPLNPERYTPHKQMKRIVSRQTTQVKMVHRIKQLIQDSEAWRVALPNGQWACPYCQEPVNTIQVQSPLDFAFNAPPKIVEHLTKHCSGYRDRRTPASDAEALCDQAMGNVDNLTPITRIGRTPTPPPVQPEAAKPTSNVASELMEKALEMAMELEEKAVEMDLELSEARLSQLRMLPDPPDLPGFDIAVKYKACTHLGGDFYDFIELQDGRLGIGVGDVTGHGATAAMVMCITKKVISMASRLDPEPEPTLVVTNEEMCKDLDGKTFVTVWYGVLDPTTALLRFVRAGHEPLVIYNPHRLPQLMELKPSGMAVGLTAGPRFEKALEVEEIQLVPGDLLCLWTDGVTEIQNSAGEEFEQQRLEEVLQSVPSDMTAEDVIEEIEVTSRRFGENKPFEDDFTVMVMRYHGQAGAAEGS